MHDLVLFLNYNTYEIQFANGKLDKMNVMMIQSRNGCDIKKPVRHCNTPVHEVNSSRMKASMRE